VPSTPVISKKSGLIYEQRLIEKYIAENGKDPVTGEQLSEDDLVLVKQSECRGTRGLSTDETYIT
jgi:pre-mRNA-processing factor 19